MDEPRARQALNLDHERRLLWLEREFLEGGRVTIVEAALANLSPKVDEVLLANRVTEGVKAALDERSVLGLNVWQKWGIAAGVLSGVGGLVLALVQSFHG